MGSVRSTASTLAVGSVVLGLYLAIAYAAVQVLLFPVVGPLRPLPTVAAVAGIAIVVGLVSYVVGTAQLLAGLDAVELTRADAPGLYRLVDGLTATMGVEEPRVLLTHTGEPNAFSISGPRGAVVIDRALLELLAPDELEAVLAHEFVHLARRDGLVKTLGASAIGTASDVLFLALLPFGLLAAALARLGAWFAGRRTVPLRRQLLRTYLAVGLAVVAVTFPLTLALRAYSRRREFAADERAAAVTDPEALLRGLRRIQQATAPERGPFSSLYLHGDDEGLLTRLLATHPPMDARIERLARRARRGRITVR